MFVKNTFDQQILNLYTEVLISFHLVRRVTSHMNVPITINHHSDESNNREGLSLIMFASTSFQFHPKMMKTEETVCRPLQARLQKRARHGDERH